MTNLTPGSGYQGSTVPFTLTGNYFLNGGTTVMLRTVRYNNNCCHADLCEHNHGPGQLHHPHHCRNRSLLAVCHHDRRRVQQQSKHVHGQSPPPITVISSISPVSGYRNTTVAFTLTGIPFPSDATTATFLNQSAGASGAATDRDPTIFSVHALAG